MFSETSCSVLFSCKMRKFVTRQPCWDQLRKYQAPPTSRSTANRNALSLKWPVIGQSLPSRARFFKAWKQSHEEVQKSSFLSEHLNYNMLKGYYGIFALMMPKTFAYCRFNNALEQNNSILRVRTFSSATNMKMPQRELSKLQRFFKKNNKYITKYSTDSLWVE